MDNFTLASLIIIALSNLVLAYRLVQYTRKIQYLRQNVEEWIKTAAAWKGLYDLQVEVSLRNAKVAQENRATADGWRNEFLRCQEKLEQLHTTVRNL